MKISPFSSQPGSPVHLSLVREAANFKLRYGRKKECISDLEQLWKQNPKDVHTLAQLISAYSLVDQNKAKSYPHADAYRSDIYATSAKEKLFFLPFYLRQILCFKKHQSL